MWSDHTPALLWNSATWEISNCILPYLHYIVEQTDNEVLNAAVDIKDGNKKHRHFAVSESFKGAV
ncbi:MAG: hypothetical protein Q8876_04505 [Bacillota bacterium]|nr:hypothetical protein [Bacillota bacterium]